MPARKPLDLKIQVPVESMSEPGAPDVDRPGGRRLGTAAGGGDPDRHQDGRKQPATWRSIWPAIYPELLELVRKHRSTIIFVNNRRGERLAVRLNELAGEGEQDGKDGREPR